ncbi:MAG: phosphotransferase, partial [Phormidesmis sp. CAN_BIN36]|nr:phosphotransferase [Phormidesmis sp. CAN_BIN36]
PQIPQYRDYFMLEQLPDSRFPWFCLVQSQVPGHSLQQMLDEGRHFTEAAVEKVAIEVLTILVYLHELNPPILHRDIKPSNLIWGEDDRLYLIDFGSVQDRAALEGVTFTVVGTYGYVPMEQFGGQTVPASDLYALGATLIHLMTGVAPADLPCQNARIQFADRVGIDPAFVNWVSQLIEPDLADRLSTARLALKTLEHRHQLSLPMVNHKPCGSRIQLKKAIDRIEIKIPARGWQALSWLPVLSALGSSWYLLFLMPSIAYNPSIGWFYLALYVLSFSGFILPALSYSVIRGDRTRFTIYWKLFGFTIGRERGKTAQIHPVIGLYEPEQWGNKGIIVQAGTKLLSTNPMAEVERRWLIQELKDWLRSGQPREVSDEHDAKLMLQCSRVEVKESADELTIQYPGQEEYWRLTTIPWCLICIFLTYKLFPVLNSFTFFVSPILVLIAALWGLGTYAIRFPTTLRFNQNRFVAYKRLLGYTIKLAEGSDTTIRQIDQDDSEKLKDKSTFTPHIAIQTLSGDYAFGHDLSKPARHWVVEAVNRWLQQNSRRV